jgi:hypothetical protein
VLRALAVLALLSVAAPARGASLSFSGMADAFLGWDSAQPHDGSVSLLTAGARSQLPTVNLVSLGAVLDAGGFHLHLRLGAGTSLDLLHAPEPSLPAGSEAFRYLMEAWLGYTIPVGRGLTIDAGLFPSHIGFEVFPTVDNWSYTHAFMAELSPYYQVGVRAIYPLSDHLVAQVLWLNGWGLVDQDRGFKSGGAQLQWSSEKLTATLNFFGGPRFPDDGTRWFGDLWAQVAPTPWLKIAGAFDLGVDARARGNVTWYAGATYVRVEPLSRFAITLRADLFDDRDGGTITGVAQRLVEATLTLEERVGPLAFRLEGRFDHGSEPTLDGQVDRGLLIAAATGRF